MAVSSPHLSMLGARRVPASPPLVHRVPQVVVDGQRDRGVTHHPAYRVEVEQAASLQVAGQLRGLTSVVEEGRRRDVQHDEVGAGLCVGLAAPATDQSHERVGHPLVPGHLAVA